MFALLWILAPGFAAAQHATVLGDPVAHADSARPFVHFDGTGSAYIVPSDPVAGMSSFTIQGLIRPDATGPEAQRFLHIQSGKTTWITLETRLKGGQWALDTYLKGPQSRLTLLDPKLTHPAGGWHWVALTYDGGTGMMSAFVDGRPELSGKVAFPALGEGETAIGVRLNRLYWYAGDIARLDFAAEALPAGSLHSAP